MLLIGARSFSDLVASHIIGPLSKDTVQFFQEGLCNRLLGIKCGKITGVSGTEILDLEKRSHITGIGCNAASVEDFPRVMSTNKRVLSITRTSF